MGASVMGHQVMRGWVSTLGPGAEGRPAGCGRLQHVGALWRDETRVVIEANGPSCGTEPCAALWEQPLVSKP